MQAAEYYLKELLFTCDCVTIPGLGGFIMQSNPARIDYDKSRIYPPTRYPSFNSLLNHDDGLLISTIARTEQVTYHESGSFVNEFVIDCKRRLSLGEKIHLEGLGELSSNSEGSIRFRRSGYSNFNPGSFGMEPLNIYPVARQKPQARLTQKPVDRKPRQLKAKQPASVRWTLILSVPVILFLLYGIIFPSSIQNLYTNYAGIVFNGLRPQRLQQPVVHEITVQPDAQAFIAHVPAPVKKIETVAEKVGQKSTRYYIIGGCFLSEENAVKFLKTLIDRGFEAEKAGSNNRGQIRISYKSFPDKAAALSYLQTIRDKENPTAWLLKY